MFLFFVEKFTTSDRYLINEKNLHDDLFVSLFPFVSRSLDGSVSLSVRPGPWRHKPANGARGGIEYKNQNGIDPPRVAEGGSVIPEAKGKKILAPGTST